MEEQWNRIRDRLATLGCLPDMALRPGAAQAGIDALEEHLGVQLPEAFRQFLRIHDGQDGQDGAGLFYGNQLLSVTGIRDAWDGWRDLDEDEMNADCADSMGSEPEGFIKPLYCNRGWIPFAHDGGGNHIGIDFDPDALGTSGQIIAFGRDEDTKRLLAPSFDAFIDDGIAWLDRAVWNGMYLDVARDAA